MGFLGIRDKSDSGLKPIVQRAPTTTPAVSAAAAHLVQPKAVVRASAVVKVAQPPPSSPFGRPAPAAAATKFEAPAAPPAPPRVEVLPSPRPKPAAPPPPPARRGEDIAHLRRGVVLQARGEHAAAVEAFTKAIEADATCVEAYASRGVSREALGDVDGARADYAKSIEVEVRAGIARHLADG